jgi:hypothetical protein
LAEFLALPELSPDHQAFIPDGARVLVHGLALMYLGFL